MGQTGNFLPEHKGIKVGDIITAYQAGYFKLVKIHERRYTNVNEIPSHWIANGTAKLGDFYSPLFEYIQIADKEGKQKKGKETKLCDAYFCELATKSIDKEITKHNEVINSLKSLKANIESQ